MLEIRYSLRAQEEQLDLLDYLLKTFGHSKTKEIYDRLEDSLSTLSRMPNMYPVSKKYKGVRKYVFSKQTSIYYRVSEEFLEIVAIRWNKKSPDRFTI